MTADRLRPYLLAAKGLPVRVLRDLLRTLRLLVRGLCREGLFLAGWWKGADRDRRQGVLMVVAVVVVLLATVVPHGLPLAAALVLVVAAVLGRAPRVPPAEVAAKLQAVYDGLVPYLVDDHDPQRLFCPGGSYTTAFDRWTVDAAGELVQLQLRYSPFFRDGEPEERARVERVIHAKIGNHRHELVFTWDESHNQLTVSAPAELPAGVFAQRFAAGAGEILVGFGEAGATARTVAVELDGQARTLPAITWRVGTRSAEPHMLVLADSGGGKSTLLRSLALQALQAGHEVVVIDGTGSGDFACLASRRGVARVETYLHDAIDALGELGDEVHRRLEVIAHAKRHAQPVAADVKRQLWLIVDEIYELAELARTAGLADPQELLEAPLRLGRAAHVTVVMAAQPAHAGDLRPSVRAQARARVALGHLDAEAAQLAFGTTLSVGTHGVLPPGRGYARIGGGPIVRLQVPYTPDPLDEETGPEDRERMLDLLPDLLGGAEPGRPVDLTKAVRPAKEPAGAGASQG